MAFEGPAYPLGNVFKASNVAWKINDVVPCETLDPSDSSDIGCDGDPDSLFCSSIDQIDSVFSQINMVLVRLDSNLELAP